MLHLINKCGFEAKITFIAKSNGKSYYHYLLWDREFDPKEPLFLGWDFKAPIDFPLESVLVMEKIISLLSLTPEDVGDEYFARYSDRQKRWLKERKDRVALLKEWSYDLGIFAEVAENIYQLANDKNYMEEWGDGFPIRLRLFNDQYEAFLGCPDNDTDHRGDWGASFLFPNQDRESCWELLMKLKEECLAVRPH